MKPIKSKASLAWIREANQAKVNALVYLLIGLALGYAIATFLDPAFPDLLEIIDNPKL